MTLNTEAQNRLKDVQFQENAGRLSTLVKKTKKMLAPKNEKHMAPLFGRNWVAHSLVDDPVHHRRHRDLHLDKEVYYKAQGDHNKAKQHHDWAVGHHALLTHRYRHHTQHLPRKDVAMDQAPLDKPTPTVQQLVEKHGVPLHDLLQQLKMGIGVESEHTSDEQAAREIALDHLNEDPEYYTKLKKVEEASIHKAMLSNLVTHHNFKPTDQHTQLVHSGDSAVALKDAHEALLASGYKKKDEMNERRPNGTTSRMYEHEEDGHKCMVKAVRDKTPHQTTLTMQYTAEAADGWSTHRDQHPMHRQQTGNREAMAAQEFRNHDTVKAFGGKHFGTSNPHATHLHDGQGNHLHHSFSEGKHHVMYSKVTPGHYSVIKSHASHHNLSVALHQAKSGLSKETAARIMDNVEQVGFNSLSPETQSRWLLKHPDSAHNNYQVHSKLYDHHMREAMVNPSFTDDEACDAHRAAAAAHFEHMVHLSARH